MVQLKFSVQLSDFFLIKNVWGNYLYSSHTHKKNCKLVLVTKCAIEKTALQYFPQNYTIYLEGQQNYTIYLKGQCHEIFDPRFFLS
jgi:hypothetical protein